jgi:branched-chain amino acid transport system ATP-binding protein
LLSTEGLSASYGHIEALRPTDITVSHGEFVAVLGPNGAGKSTLLRAIARLINSRGAIYLAGQMISRSPAHALAGMGVAFVPENRGIFGPMTVHENLSLGAYARPARDRAAVADDFEAVLNVFPRLRERLQQVSGSLSGGEQQMLAIGRALMVHPRLLLLDEPSLGLSPRMASEIFQALDRLNKNGLTILVVEQKAPLALSLANRAYVLRTGSVVATPDPKDIKSPDALAHYYLSEIEK